MNADEIVKALRCEHGHLTNRGRDFMLNYTREEFFKILNESADLIESLQADLRHEEKVSHGQMEQNKRLRRINENLQEQLAASQRREQAAVEDLHRMHTLCMDIGACCPECGSQIDDLTDAACTYCKKSGVGCWEEDQSNELKCAAFEWRGPQEARKGAAE